MQTLGKTLSGLLVALVLMGAASAPTTEWSADRLHRIDTLLNTALDDKLMVGGQGLIWQDGQLI